MVLKIIFVKQVTTTYKETRSPEEMKEMMELALRGLQLLSEWTSIVTELYSVRLVVFFFFF
jgi:hypothetical protein